jgi:hypothetical protein
MGINASRECVEAFKAFTGKYGQAAGKELLQQIGKVNVLSELSPDKEDEVIAACAKPPSATGAEAVIPSDDEIRENWRNPKKRTSGTAEAE